MNFWLLKSEPDAFSIDHLKEMKSTIWDGVRNYQSRNTLMQMKVGDLAFFYHSSTAIPGIAGLVRVTEENIVDPSQLDPKSDYFDPKATREKPRWWTARVEFVEKFPILLTLQQLTELFNPEDLPVVRKGNRLSVTIVDVKVGKEILNLCRK